MGNFRILAITPLLLSIFACSSSDDSSDDEVYAGRGRSSLNRDGTVATGSAQELRLLESLAKAGGRVAAGRFGGRDAKMERIRRQEELEAQQVGRGLPVICVSSRIGRHRARHAAPGLRRSR